MSTVPKEDNISELHLATNLNLMTTWRSISKDA